MKGWVEIIDTGRRFFGVRLEDGRYTVFELMDPVQRAPNMGDAVEGRLQREGDAALTNHTRRLTFNVSVQATGLTKEAAERLVNQ
jgi:hypothetical protein